MLFFALRTQAERSSPTVRPGRSESLDVGERERPGIYYRFTRAVIMLSPVLGHSRHPVVTFLDVLDESLLVLGEDGWLRKEN